MQDVRTFPRHSTSSRSLRSDLVSHISPHGLSHSLSTLLGCARSRPRTPNRTEPPPSRGAASARPRRDRDRPSNPSPLQNRKRRPPNPPSANMTMGEPPQKPPGGGLAAQKQMPSLVPGGNNAPPLAEAASVPDSAAGVTTPKADPSAGRNDMKSLAKVAIPRQRSGVAPRYNRRVPRACESCRQRKTKCSGDTPVCRQCRELRVICQYPVGWKERTKR